MMKKRIPARIAALILIAGAFFVSVPAYAAPKSAGPWSDWKFFIGNWVGEGSGTPGNGSGEFSLQPDLQGQILIRRSRAEYPATAKSPAYVHDDLMIVYKDNGETRADYFDSEGHVIHYAVTLSDDGKQAIFLSDSDPDADDPQYRLTYTAGANDSLAIKFEIAQAGKPFATYITAEARRAR